MNCLSHVVAHCKWRGQSGALISSSFSSSVVHPCGRKIKIKRKSANSQSKCNSGRVEGGGSELAGLRRLGLSQAEIGRQLGRHRRTVGRELKRHAAPYEGWVSGGAGGAGGGAEERKSGRGATASLGERSWPWSKNLLREEWSPEQVSGYLRRSGELLISHETIYRQVSCGSVRD